MSAQAPAAIIAVSLNGQPKRLPSGSTLEMLLQREGIAPGEVATALNGDFVPRALRTTRLLAAGDAITCFRPIVGG